MKRQHLLVYTVTVLIASLGLWSAHAHDTTPGVLASNQNAATLRGDSGPLIDGSAADVLYGDALAIQDTATGFGDATLGRPDLADGSELDAAYAVVYGDMLYLVLAGNLETNWNDLEIFFDTRAGGQNQLGPDNPDRGGLMRMGYLDDEFPGFKFDADFSADFYVTAQLAWGSAFLSVEYAELYH